MDISFLITTYNSGKFIKRCIDSCLNQEKHNLQIEIIIVNDGSTDNTLKILQNYNNLNICKIYHQNNSGIEKSINSAFKKAKGKFFIRVDADDFLQSNYLNSIQKHLNNKECFYYTNYNLVNVKEELIKEVLLPKFDRFEILERGDFMATGTIFPRNLIKKYGYYQERIKNCGLENYDFILRLLDHGVKGILIPETVVFYRRHNENMSVEKIKSIIKFGNELANKYNLGKYKTNRYHPYGLKI